MLVLLITLVKLIDFTSISKAKRSSWQVKNLQKRVKMRDERSFGHNLRPWMKMKWRKEPLRLPLSEQQQRTQVSKQSCKRPLIVHNTARFGSVYMCALQTNESRDDGLRVVWCGVYYLEILSSCVERSGEWCSFASYLNNETSHCQDQDQARTITQKPDYNVPKETGKVSSFTSFLGS